MGKVLTVAGKSAYHIGNIGGTCEFFFERLEGANQSVSPAEIADQLKHGLKEIDGALLEKIKPILPDGEYIATLLEVVPKSVLPGSRSDYFCNEQIDLWGIDGFGIYRTTRRLSITGLVQRISVRKKVCLSSLSPCPGKLA